MVILNQRQRAVLLDKVPDAANLAVGALFFGQFLADRPFSFALALWGAGIWLGLFCWVTVLASERSNS